MPRLTLNPVSPSITGTTVAFVAADAAGDSVPANCAVLVNNASGSSITVTLVTGATADDYAIADPTVAVPAGTIVAIGPFSQLFPQTSGADAGRVYLNYSAVTSVTRAAIVT